MRQFMFALMVCTLPLHAVAQDATPKQNGPLFEGLDELAEGMRNLLEGLQDDVAPMMDELADQLRGLNTYHPPEVLPNGDIIIRRKTPEEVPTLPKTDNDEAIDI